MNRIIAFLKTNYWGEAIYVWLLLLFFLIARIIYILLLGGFDKSEFMDANGYNEYALAILKNKTWLTNYDFLASWREPIYPIFVAIIYFFAGAENFFAVYIVQAILGTATLFFIYKLSLLALGNRRAGLLSLIWAGFYIGYLRFTGELLREPLIVFLIIYLFYQAYRLIAGKITIRYYFILALIYTCLIHTDGRYIFYAPFLFFIFILNFKDFKISLIRYLIFGVFTIMLTIPWSVRNYLTYGNVIIVNKYTLSIGGGNQSERSDLFNMSKIDSVYTTIHYTHNENYPNESERKLIKQGNNPNKRTAQEIRLIKNNLYPSKTFLGRKWHYIKAMWKPFDFSYGYAPFPQAFFEGTWSLKHNLLSIVSYGVLLPFFVIGIFISFRERNKGIYLLLLPIFVHFLLHAITFGLERYRYPIDAFIIIISCYGIVYIFTEARKKLHTK